jgi:DNA-binding transcriptional regulator YiaG
MIKRLEHRDIAGRDVWSSLDYTAVYPMKNASMFGQALVAARKHLRMTKAALGQRLGVHYHTVARWEKGRFMPDRADRPRLIEALAGAPNDVLTTLGTMLGVPVVLADKQPTARAGANDDVGYVVDSALLALVEHLPGVAVGTLRVAFDAALARIDAKGVDVGSARRALATKTE